MTANRYANSDEALDAIAETLARVGDNDPALGVQWNGDTLDAIAEIVRSTGRTAGEAAAAEHPADCQFCAAGEASEHQYEPPAGRDDGSYSAGPWVAVRVFEEGDHWSIDAVDAAGGYSEEVWTHWGDEPLTRAAALEHAPDFAWEVCGEALPLREVPA